MFWVVRYYLSGLKSDILVTQSPKCLRQKGLQNQFSCCISNLCHFKLWFYINPHPQTVVTYFKSHKVSKRSWSLPPDNQGVWTQELRGCCICVLYLCLYWIFGVRMLGKLWNTKFVRFLRSSNFQGQVIFYGAWFGSVWQSLI